MLYCYLFLVINMYFSYATYPVAIFHGLGDHCESVEYSMANDIRDTLNVYTKCIEVGNGVETTYFASLME